jgi:flagellar hook-associated protein 3 FlgL
MRVTNQMMGNSLKQNIQNNLSKLSRTQEQLSTGNTILRPSDAPTDISRLMAVKAQREINKQYTQNIDDGLTYLYSTDTALGTAGEMLAQANELAVQGANGTLSKEDMQAIGEQIDKMIDEMVDVANTTAGGKYIFAGRTNSQPPFYRDPSDPDKIMYRGDLKRISREIANLSEHTVDAPGVLGGEKGVFGEIDAAQLEADSEAEVTDGVFKTLIDLRDALNSGDHEAVNNMVDDIQSTTDHILVQRVAVGARTRHFEAVKDQMTDQEIRLSQVMQDIQSADIARLSIDFGQQQLTYQATLSAGANIMQTSLLNFLK